MDHKNPIFYITGTKREETNKELNRDNVAGSVSDKSDCEKIAVIQEKFNQLLNELRKTSSTLMAMKRQYIHQEGIYTDTDVSEISLEDTKLEDSFYELQRKMRDLKKVVSEAISLVKENEESRREVAGSSKQKLNVETIQLKEKESEDHLASENREVDLSMQLFEIQLKNLQNEVDIERKLFEQERNVLIVSFKRSEELNRILQANQRSMKNMIDMYKIFDSFKMDLEKLQTTNFRLKQEKDSFFADWRTSEYGVELLAELYQHRSSKLKSYMNEMSSLERINLQLKAEHSTYLKQLQENQIFPVVVPQSPDSFWESPSQSTISDLRSETATKLIELKKMKEMEDHTQAGQSSASEELSCSAVSSSETVPEQTQYALPPNEPAMEMEEKKALFDELAGNEEELEGNAEGIEEI